MYAVKGLKCSEGHTLLQNDLDKFRALYEHGDMELWVQKSDEDWFLNFSGYFLSQMELYLEVL